MPKFSRDEGDRYIIQQRFSDENFPRCPFCGTDSPKWNTAYKYRGMMKYYLIKCSNCASIMSISEADMTGLSYTTVSTEGQLKKLSGKESRSVYVRVNEIGLNLTDPKVMRLERKEMTIDELKMYSEKVLQIAGGKQIK